MGVDERLSLDAVSEHTLIAVEHRHRYLFARAAAQGRRVVDLCCGAGYGSAILAETAAEVVGVDRDAAAVDTAQAAVGGETVRFVAADALDHLRRLEPADVDLVVCFEGLEHLPAVGDVVAQLARLVEGGVGLLASVPNSATFGEDNEFHLTDFDPTSARELFSVVPGATFAYQTHAEGSVIRGQVAGSIRAEVAVGGEQDLDWANHLLVLAGVDAQALLDPADAALHLAVAPVNHRYMRHLEQANRELLAANGRLARGRLGLGGAGRASAVLRGEDELTAARGREAQAREELDAVRGRISALEAELAGVRAERDGYRRAWMAVHSSRLINLAARLAGHRFDR